MRVASMAPILVVLACESTAPARPLRYPEITAGVLARIDTNRDGVVDAAEYGRVSLEDDPLSSYDTDGDGALSAFEVEASVLGTNPVILAGTRVQAVRAAMQRGRRDGGRGMGPPGVGPPGGGAGGGPPGRP